MQSHNRTSNSPYPKGGGQPPRNHGGGSGAHHLPIRANTGGYLRSPLAISDAFANAAEKHVGNATTASSSSSSHNSMLRAWQRRGEEADAADDNSWMEGRRWTRAGVGAGLLSVTQKTAQQTAAERVYGNDFFSTGKDADGRDTLQVAQSHQFGVDRREKETMKSLLPRSLRQEQRRRLMQASNGNNAGNSNDVRNGDGEDDTHSAEEERKEEKSKIEGSGIGSAQRNNPNGGGGGGGHKRAREPNTDEYETRETINANSTKSNEKRTTSSSSSSSFSAVMSGGSSSPRSGGNKPTPTPAAPMNRMQQIQRMREEALFGKKKKKAK